MSSYKDSCCSHVSDDWSTPKEIYDFFVHEKDFFDPCPLNSNGCDALFISWGKYNFVNPPYSDLKRFVEKAIIELDNGNNSVLLIPFRPDTKWFKMLYDSNKALFVMLNGRLSFGGIKHTAPFPSIFVYLSNDLTSNKFDLISKKDIISYFSVLFLFKSCGGY